MARTHLTRKQLKEDAIQEAGKSLFEYLMGRRHQILTILLAVAALALLATAGRGFARRSAERANQNLLALQTEYDRSFFLGDESARALALDAVIESASDFHEKHGAKPVGLEALLIQGNAQFLKREYAAARQTFERYIASAPSREGKARGYLALGDTLINESFHDNDNRDLLEKAKAAYANAAQLGVLPNGANSYLSCEALFGKAQAMTMLGELAEARRLYEQIREERPFYEEKVREMTPDDMENWMTMNRQEKTLVIRRDALQRKAASSFQERAERHLEEMKKRAETASTETAP